MLYNNSLVKQRRRDLRNNLTDAERLLWRHIRNRQIEGFRWRRQYSVGEYILDFYCPELHLAIELDGGQHAETSHIQHDQERTYFLKKQSMTVLRFWNNEVLKNIDGVIENIRSVAHSSR